MRCRRLKDINFFEETKKPSPHKQANRTVLAGIIAVGICIVAIVGAYIYVLVGQLSSRAEIESFNNQIYELKASTPGLGEVEPKLERLKGIKAYAEIITSFDNSAQSQPKLDASFLKGLASKLPSDVSVLHMEYNEGILVLNCTAKNELSPPNMADAFKKLDYFDSVTYGGYQIIVSSTGQENSEPEAILQFSLECVVKGGNA